MASKHFTDAKAWQAGHRLALTTYKVLATFPKEERYSLTDQLRRAVISVPSNIAEGFNRFSPKEKIQFYSIALASASEAQSQLILAKDLGYIEPSAFTSLNQQIETTRKLLTALIKSIRAAA